MRNMIYRLSPWQPRTFLLVSVVVALVGMVMPAVAGADGTGSCWGCQ